MSSTRHEPSSSTTRHTRFDAARMSELSALDGEVVVASVVAEPVEVGLRDVVGEADVVGLRHSNEYSTVVPSEQV
ncbi:hypothetical protein ACFVYA_47825 [Amycolatopsis sp. NPDC058278]|uniref:hypothetical protein n=1 Tax=Amycolatopsis sp. NPDC058278 TaxID=3346417 RepID=UPI0036D9162E